MKHITNFRQCNAFSVLKSALAARTFQFQGARSSYLGVVIQKQWSFNVPFIICEGSNQTSKILGGVTHARRRGRYVVTSAIVVLQSAAAGHSANMWLRCLAAFVLIAATASKEVFTNSFLVRFKRSVQHEEAHHVARAHGFESLGPVRYTW